MKKSVYLKLKKKEYLPLAVFAVIITAFCLIFLRLFIKMDDGNFLGIVFSPGFTYSGWLSERYNTVSGRTVGEFLLAFFLKHNLVYWKVANSTVIIYIVYFWCRMSACFNGEYSLNERRIFCCCGIFLMIVSCLNPSAFWLAGSFSYLWPFAGILLTVSPLVFYLLESKLSTAEIIFSCFSAVIGTMQEQSAACCTAIYLILLGLIGKQKLKMKMFSPLLTILLSDFWMFTSPGISGRAAMEAQNSFERYLDFDFFQKLACGLSVFFANSFYLSFFLLIVFVFLLSLKISEKTVGLKTGRLLRSVNLFACLVCVLLNVIVSVTEKALPHMIFRKAFISGEYGIGFYILFSVGCILTLAILIMLIALIIVDRAVGIATGLCASAGFFSAIATGFSPTVFASGQRIAFYTNMFVVTACVVLISSIRKTKSTDTIYSLSVIYACGSFAVDCIAFKISEIPLMG